MADVEQRALPENVHKLDLFKDLKPKQRKLLDAEAYLDVTPSGSVFTYQGDFTGKFRFIIEGLVSAYREERSETTNLGTYGAGDWFGEQSALSNRPEPATLRAESRCVFLVIDQALFKQLYKAGKSFQEQIDATYLERALAAHLRVAPVFKALSERKLRRLRRNAEMLQFKKGDVIARAGQLADALYLVRSGAIRCVGRDDKGREKTYLYLSDNSSFGERSLGTTARRWPGNYEAMAPTAIVKLSREAIQKAFEGDRKVLETVIATADLIVAEEEGEGTGFYDLDFDSVEESDISADELEIMVGKQSVKGGEALVIDLSRCIRCNACVESCVAVHEDRVPRLSKTGNRIGGSFNLASSCYNCDIPECMMACEYGAIRRDVQGLIRFVWDNCTGCQCCTTACPYGVISMTPPPQAAGEEPRQKRHWFLGTLPFIGHRFQGTQPCSSKGSEPSDQPVLAALRGTKVSGKAVKCDLCAGLPFEACVYNCPCSAISRVSPERLFDEEGMVRV